MVSGCKYDGKVMVIATASFVDAFEGCVDEACCHALGGGVWGGGGGGFWWWTW